MSHYTLSEAEAAVHMAETQRNNALADLAIIRAHCGANAVELGAVVKAFPNAPGREDVKRAIARLLELKGVAK